MLKNPEGSEIKGVPHPEEYKDLLDHLDPSEQKELTAIMVDIISKGSFHNSSILGHRHINTIPRLHELLLKASNGDTVKVGRYFGLYLFVTFMQIDEEWYIQKPKSGGRFMEKGYDYYKRPADLKKKYLKT